ncbi:MAG: B12-binding domain-containing radical SAM protein [Proteobacteria bacterium]|nr:B12-binding domain-containing radical SAM protein [Pseudomonadota bacterium]
MRFLLVNPFYPISETPSPPLGLAFLAGALERAGVEVRLLDLVVHPYSRDRLEALIDEFRPDAVGATAVTMTFDHAIEIIEDVKRVAPGVRTVMGGPHVSFCGPETMLRYSALDFVVLGEGELTIVELAEAMDRGSGWERIPGLIYRLGPEIVSTEWREPVADVDSLPQPARHLVPLGRYRALGMPVSMTTSRGCPFNCIFCVGRKMVGAKVRYRDPIQVVDELEYLSTLDFHQINIADDLFTANKKHCHAVCDEIIRRGLKTKWTSFARVDTVSREVLAKMREAGCDAVSFGIETANAEILKTIRKGITTDQVVEAIQMCIDTGVTPFGSFILGLPGETPETIAETLAFGDRIKAMGTSYGFHLLAPFPGTEVREQSEKYGLKILTDDWREYHANRSIVETETVTREMMDDIVIEWEREFDEYLGDIKQRRELGQTTPEEAWPLDKLEHTVLIYDLMMNGAIEERGHWPQGPGPVSEAEALATLADRIMDRTRESRAQVESTLGYALGKGALELREEDGLLRWAWVEYL